MTLIAIEEHWTTPELAKAVKALPDGRRDDSLAFNEIGDHLARLEDLGDARIAAMDEQGVDLQILGLAPPGTQPLDPADARSLSRRANDLAAEAVRRHPTRFRALSTLPLADPAAAAGELERAAGLGFVGVMVYVGWGWHLEAALAALRLIARGVFDRHPFQHPGRPEIRDFLGAFGSDADREKFTAGNARKLFRLDAIGSMPTG